MTGLEREQELPPKVLGMYRAVMELIAEGGDVNNISVATITQRAGIGKGTAYDYFDTKEEIMACALIFYMVKAMEGLREQLLQEGSFIRQIQYLLDTVEQKSGNQHCFLRFVHVLTGNTEFSELVRQKIMCGEFRSHLPKSVFGEVIAAGQERGEIRKDLPMDYLIYTIFARILTYIVSIVTSECFAVHLEQLRPFIFQGIIEELQA